MHDIYKRNGLSSSTSHHDRQIPNFSRPSILFPKQSKDFLSFLKFKEFSCLALNSRLAQEPCSSLQISGEDRSGIRGARFIFTDV